MRKAKEKRQMGMGELPGALLMMMLGLVLLILAAYILAAALGGP